MTTSDAVRPAIVLFADLLGFSHQVQQARKPEDALKLTAKIKRFASNFSDSGANSDFYAKKYWAFSDSIVVAWYKGSEAEMEMTEFDANLFELSGVAFAQAMTMYEDSQLVRGGIGAGWLMEDAEAVVGDALVIAARLEKNVSTPFIAVESDLYDYYRSHRGRGNYHESIDPIPELFIPPSEYTNHLPALDYLATAIGEIDLTDADIYKARSIPPGSARDAFHSERAYQNKLNFAIWHRDFVLQGRRSDDPRIKEKYDALGKHHNFRISQIFPNAPEALITG